MLTPCRRNAWSSSSPFPPNVLVHSEQRKSLLFSCFVWKCFCRPCFVLITLSQRLQLNNGRLSEAAEQNLACVASDRCCMNLPHFSQGTLSSGLRCFCACVLSSYRRMLKKLQSGSGQWNGSM